MSANKSLFSSTNTLTLRLLRSEWALLLILFAASTTIGIRLEDQLSNLGGHSDTDRILLAITGGLADLIEGIILIFILSWAIPRVHPLDGPQFLKEPFNRAYVSTFFAEYLRVLGKVLLWALALIIPGMIRYVQLSMVPLIVFFSKKYEDGDVDAVALSTKMVNQRWKLLFGAFAIVTVLSVGLQLGPSFYAELHTTPIRVTFSFLSSLLAIWSYCLIFLVFEQEMQK